MHHKEATMSDEKKNAAHDMNRRNVLLATTSLVAASALGAAASVEKALAQAQPAPSGQRPNIVFIMGDDVGWFNIGAYHQGIMAGRTPNLDRLASEGMRFTDYYAEASCTAGRANFITGELPIRTGLTTVGQAGATTGMPAQAPTICDGVEIHGLCDRTVRQEPFGRSQPVLADRAWLRRVFWLPLSSRCDGRSIPSQLSACA
jgi:hypothetical protein